MALTMNRAREILLARWPWLARIREEQASEVALALLAVSAVMGVAGGTWDAAWHVTLLRETFWTPPHLLLYSGTALALGAALFGAAIPWLTGTGDWRRAPGFAVAAAGAAIVIAAAPLDDFWHRTFGRDVDVWSFPHLVALAGGAAINIGAALACKQRLRGGHSLWVRAAQLLFLTALLWVSMFALNWYTLVLARVRDSLQYPVLASFLAVAVMVAIRWLWGGGGAMVVSAMYMAYVIAAHSFLSSVGFALLPFPPMLLVPAVAVDAIAGGRGSPVRALLAGLAFVPLLLAAEAASLAWYPHPAVPPPRSEVAFGYVMAAAERPWDLQHVLMALPFVLLAAALGALLGNAIARACMRLLARA
jgi:hypothetical protein